MRNRLLKSFALFALLATVFASCTNNYNGDVVDLGLPSGVKWATCNLGAANPWEYGNYYAWGETETKNDYSWETYKYCNITDTTITKYCNNAEYGNGGFTDTLTTLESADDAATAVLGSDYSLPTIADWEELNKECYWVWTGTYNNRKVNGYVVYKAKSADDKGTIVYADGTPSSLYSISDIHIFLPAAGGCGRRGDHVLAGTSGFYWSPSLDWYSPDHASNCVFHGGNVHPLYSDGRYVGLSVRPVRRK
ncbi:MAG: hypothetical protein IKW86_07110 [Salinivirgaceae bacterium]|nr:hypothetical protein [Salinivirgaceae bacterium]